LKRLDQILVDKGLAPTLQKAQAYILSGEVWLKEQRLDKAGQKYPEDIAVELRSKKIAYVSRGGLKLEHGLNYFNQSVKDRVCLDVGSSTGGFTDCLLQKGAKHIFSVDVGYGLLDSTLRGNPKITILEKTNARELTPELISHPLAKEITFCCMDISFISLRAVLPQIVKKFSTISDFILLFKPQFEVEQKYVLSGGIVKDQAVISEALNSFQSFAKTLSLSSSKERTSSPIEGKKSGNQEFLFHLTH
jgi:23S rRNA (cytidine1920-2'-O)/16S rRNA (cytidine1409-2'-O)-methyltransferase